MTPRANAAPGRKNLESLFFVDTYSFTQRSHQIFEESKSARPFAMPVHMEQSDASHRLHKMKGSIEVSPEPLRPAKRQ